MKIISVIFIFILISFTTLSVKDKIQIKTQNPFPDFGYMVPASEVTNSNDVFKLSQNYPKTLPNNQLPKFYNINYHHLLVLNV